MFINKLINLELQRTLRRLLAGNIGICMTCANGARPRGPATSRTIHCNHPRYWRLLTHSWLASKVLEKRHTLRALVVVLNTIHLALFAYLSI